ncbi:hypothetical protein CYLTODRAFT_6570 [Cylindrobasidium torrendii FP15055 ss-10]|uniref:DNA mismatch repair proteins mutS family domain-containing protein n=1 Tax=Cylindrobasidium torrendii FP15055 ss-10 TaxID=1314674 RepID=A0A0D7BQG0_9AGAR|nr:hypothetical protein CYLTODRAFT_6570 [Cylindrobasidium torrendii FP15055 ss-10]
MLTCADDPTDELETLEDIEQPKKTLAREIRENLAKFPHCLLLTRVGQFYESYFDQAVEISQLLNIKLASRKWENQRIHMCGFPIAQLDRYLKILVEQNKRFVAMCEEFPRYQPQLGTRTFERRVTRIITPGTLIDESFLNQYENNYLLSIGTPNALLTDNDALIGLAWIDVSTGEFYTKSSTLECLRDDIARIGPREVVLDSRIPRTHPIIEALNEDKNFLSFISCDSVLAPPPTLPPDAPLEQVTDELVESSEPATSATTYTPEEALAIDFLTTFLKDHLLEHMPSLATPNRENVNNRMEIDSHTIKSLEIRENIREGGQKGSLLSTIKRTITTSGTRLLLRWLCSPSTSISEINSRLSLVQFFHARPFLREDLASVLGKIEDATRIAQKFSMGRGDVSDLLAIKNTTKTWALLRKQVETEKAIEERDRGEHFKATEWESLEKLMRRLADMEDLSTRIEKALHAEVVGSSQDPSAEEEEAMVEDGMARSWRYPTTKWKIRPEYSQTLKTLHTRLSRLLREKEQMESSLQMIYDAPSLTMRSSPGLGLHVHLAKAKRDSRRLDDDAAFVSIQTSNTTVSYLYPEWSRLGADIFDTSMRLVAEEKAAFEELRREVVLHAPMLRRNARIMDELDVTLSFANLAADMNFVRPILTEGNDFEVHNARHPSVELGLMTNGRMFTPNTLDMRENSQLQIITGPNMAGKSTLLRQTALIALLAQAGSFVPAGYARIGIVDKLFSRVGAKDDLFHDRSTFMVEMLETSEILRRATPRSLVIMDEVGRGTTIKDGLALAYATIHHLATVNQSRTLFATHFTELSDMLGYSEGNPSPAPFDSVSFFCTDVAEVENGRFAYSYRVRPGVSKDSHGLKVALLAGMPPH